MALPSYVWRTLRYPSPAMTTNARATRAGQNWLGRIEHGLRMPHGHAQQHFRRLVGFALALFPVLKGPWGNAHQGSHLPLGKPELRPRRRHARSLVGRLRLAIGLWVDQPPHVAAFAVGHELRDAAGPGGAGEQGRFAAHDFFEFCGFHDLAFCLRTLSSLGERLVFSFLA